MNMISIYGLLDPRDNVVKYVGKTRKKICARLTEHLRDPGISKKCAWIKSLKNNELVPQIIEIEKVGSDEEANISERFWISSLKAAGAVLKNMTDGGDGVRLVGCNNGMYGRKHSEATKETIRRKRVLQGNPRLGTGAGNITKTCPLCKKDFTVCAAKSKRDKIFCNRKCYAASDLFAEAHAASNENKGTKVLTDDGREFSSITKAIREIGGSKTKVCDGLRSNGFVVVRGVTLRLAESRGREITAERA